MSDLGIFDFDWVRGTTMPLVVTLKVDGTPIPADDVRLSVYNGSALAFRLSLADNAGSGPGKVTNDTGTYTFTPTEQQTRSLKQGKRGQPGKSAYEIAVRNGRDEKVYIMGAINGIGGINDDEEIPS